MDSDYSLSIFKLFLLITVGNGNSHEDHFINSVAIGDNSGSNL